MPVDFLDFGDFFVAESAPAEADGIHARVGDRVPAGLAVRRNILENFGCARHHACTPILENW